MNNKKFFWISFPIFVAFCMALHFGCLEDSSDTTQDDDDATDDDAASDDDTDDDSQDEPYIVDTSDSGCLEANKDSEPQEGIEFSYDDGVLTVVHTNVIYNCCMDRIDVKMEVEEFVISLYETEIVPNPCYCNCYFNVTTLIAGLESGTYRVDIYVRDEFSVSGEVEIP